MTRLIYPLKCKLWFTLRSPHQSGPPILIFCFFPAGYNRVDHNADSTDIGYWSDGRQTGVAVGVWAPYEPQVDKGDCVYIGPRWDQQDNINRWYFDTCNHVYPAVCQRTPCPEGEISFSCTPDRVFCIFNRFNKAQLLSL